MNGPSGVPESRRTGRPGERVSPGGTGSGAVAERVAEARRVLDAAGIRAAVRAVGMDGEIAAVTGAPELKGPLARVAPELRAAGFRYVALELNNERKGTTQDT